MVKYLFILYIISKGRDMLLGMFFVSWMANYVQVDKNEVVIIVVKWGPK